MDWKELGLGKLGGEPPQEKGLVLLDILGHLGQQDWGSKGLGLEGSSISNGHSFMVEKKGTAYPLLLLSPFFFCLKYGCCRGWVEKQLFWRSLVWSIKPFLVLLLAVAAGWMG